MVNTDKPRSKWAIEKAIYRAKYPEKAKEQMRRDVGLAREKARADDPDAYMAQMATDKADYRARNPHKVAEGFQRLRADVPAYLLQKAKMRAAKRGLPFSITQDDIVVPEFCPVFGVRLEFGDKASNSPSLDRIVPELGYVPGNVRVMSHRANRLRSDATLDELRSLVAFLADT